MDGTGGESDRGGCWRADIKMGGKNGGETDDISGLHWSVSGLWMTKYGAVRVLLGLLGDCSRVWRIWQMNMQVKQREDSDTDVTQSVPSTL